MKLIPLLIIVGTVGIVAGLVYPGFITLLVMTFAGLGCGYLAARANRRRP